MPWTTEPKNGCPWVCNIVNSETLEVEQMMSSVDVVRVGYFIKQVSVAITRLQFGVVDFMDGASFKST